MIFSWLRNLELGLIQGTFRRKQSAARRRLNGPSATYHVASIVESLEQRRMLTAPAVPTTIQVTTTSDAVSHTGVSLRDAITQADNGVAGDTITFASSLTASGPATITLSQGVLNISNSMTITGLGASNLAVDGNNASQIFNITGSTVSITGLTIQHANNFNNSLLGNAIGIHTGSTVTLANDSVSNNVATAYPNGTVYNQGTLNSTNDNFSGNTSLVIGGAIYNTGTLTSKNDTIKNNTSQGGGGIWSNGSLTTTNDTISGNTSTGNGGGVLDQSTWTSTGDDISNNVSNSSGGGVYLSNTSTTATTTTMSGDTISGNTSNGVSGNGGAGIYVHSGNMGVVSSNNTVMSNTAIAGGGGIEFNTSGNTFTSTNDTISKNQETGYNTYGGGILMVSSIATAQMTLSGDTISNNSATAAVSGGGGIYQNGGIISSTNDTFSQNAAANGGGFYVIGTLNSTNDKFTSNQADGAQGSGGAIEEAGSAPKLTLSGDTLSKNTAISNGGGISGGGVLLSSGNTYSQNTSVWGDAIDFSGTFDSTNDTFTGNTAVSSAALGGAIFVTGPTSLVNDTITNNSAISNSATGEAEGGGVFFGGAHTIQTSTNDTISGNVATNTATAASTTTVAAGGGVYDQGTWTSTNDTIANNSATSSSNSVTQGGGIYSYAYVSNFVNDTVTNNSALQGGGIYLSNVTDNSINSIFVGNQTGGNINGGFRTAITATNTLVGDAATGTTITNTNGNHVGIAQNAVFVDDSNGNPLLANNGGTNQTVGLAGGSPAINAGAALTSVTPTGDAGTTLTVASGTFIAAGDLLQIGTEIVSVTALSGTTLTVARAQDGTSQSASLNGLPVTLAFDERGFAGSSTPSIGAFQPIIVNSLSDTATDSSISGPTVTLREAINYANSATGTQSIAFAPSLTASGPATITLTHGELDPTGSITITGPGANLLSISGNNSSRIFGLYGSSSVDVSIADLTLEDGSGGSGGGGAILNDGNLTLIQNIISNNNSGSTVGGGGVENDGTITSTGNTFDGNSSSSQGGGINNDTTGTWNSTNDTFEKNAAASTGGGIANSGILTTTNDTIVNDSATGNGGGLAVNSGATWNSINSIFASNTQGEDVSISSGSGTAPVVNVQNTLIDDSSSGLTNNVSGNLIGTQSNPVFAVDSNNIPVLSSNGGPTPTVALVQGSAAIHSGGALTSVTSTGDAGATLTVNNATFISVGDALQIGNEIVVVTNISGNLLSVDRAIGGTTQTIAGGLDGLAVSLAYDQRSSVRDTPNDIGAFELFVNEPPTLTAGTIAPLSVKANAALTSFGLSSVKFGPGGGVVQAADTLTYMVTVVPSSTLGHVYLSGGTTAVTANTTYTLTQIEGMEFKPAANVTGSGTFTFTVQNNGGTANGGSDTLTESIAINVTPTAPVLSGVETTPLIDSVSTPVTVTSAITLIDNESTTVSSATIQISGGYQNGSDSLVFTPAGGTNITVGSWNSSNGTLTLIGKDTVANYQAALRLVKFENTGTNATSRTISFKINDGTASSNAVTRVIEIPPAVVSIVPVSANPITGTLGVYSQTFNVIFNEPVTGVQASDFTFVTNGPTGGTLSLSGSGASYAVTITGLKGNGTLGVNLTNFASIKGAGNLAVTSGATGTVLDLLPPGGYIVATPTQVKIFGSSLNDVVTITEGSSLVITVDGQTHIFDPTKINTIIDYASDGNDTTTVNSLNYGTRFEAFAGSGNDNITVNSAVAGNVTLVGGTGNDTLAGGSGNDVIYSGTASNVISDGNGTDRLILSVPTISNAVDVITNAGSTSTLNLTSFTDGLTFSLAVGSGTAQTADPTTGFTLDLPNNAFSTVLLGGNAGTTNIVTGNSTLGTKIVGGLGNNTLAGGAGNDILDGGSGNSLLTDGNGNDRLVGGGGNSTLTAGNGNDLLIGGLGDSSVTAGDGNDRLYGGYSNSTVTAGNGNDVLIGGSLNNTLSAGAGNDTFDPGTENNVISGGSGTSKFNLPVPTIMNAVDVITNAGSTSTLNLTSFTDGLTFSLATGSGIAQTADPTTGFTLDLPNNAFSTVLLGGNAGTTNIVTGNSTLGTKIVGGLGNNTLAGGAGNDILDGGSGNSLLTDGNGNDRLVGGNGNSTLTAGNGNDLLIGGLGDSSVTAGDGNDRLYGGYGNSTLTAGNGTDLLVGGNLNNTLTGGSGQDTFDTGTENNVVSGGNGVSRFNLAVPTIANAKDTLTDTGTTSTLNLGAFTDGLTFSLAIGSGTAQTVDPSTGFQLDIQNGVFRTVDLGGVAGTTNFVIGNSTLGTKIVGELGNNVLVGGAGNDTLIGGPGDDILIGGLGTDLLESGNNGLALMIGGTLSFDATMAGLIAIESEWASTDSYATRVADLLGPGIAATATSPAGQSGGSNGNYYVNSSTVTLGSTQVGLYGGGVNDWFWATSLDKTNRDSAEDLN